jgi:hypothetical protein
LELSAQRILPWLFSFITWHSLFILTLYLDFQTYQNSTNNDHNTLSPSDPNATVNNNNTNAMTLPSSSFLAGSPLLRLLLRACVIGGGFLATRHLTQSTTVMWRALAYGLTIYCSILLHVRLFPPKLPSDLLFSLLRILLISFFLL